MIDAAERASGSDIPVTDPENVLVAAEVAALEVLVAA